MLARLVDYRSSSSVPTPSHPARRATTLLVAALLLGAGLTACDDGAGGDPDQGPGSDASRSDRAVDAGADVAEDSDPGRDSAPDRDSAEDLGPADVPADQGGTEGCLSTITCASGCASDACRQACLASASPAAVGRYQALYACAYNGCLTPPDGGPADGGSPADGGADAAGIDGGGPDGGADAGADGGADAGADRGADGGGGPACSSGTDTSAGCTACVSAVAQGPACSAELNECLAN